MGKRLAVFALLAACGAPNADGPAKVEIPPQPAVLVAVDPVAPVASAMLTAPPPFRCVDGVAADANGRHYCAYSDLLGWNAAEARCILNGGHLASFETEPIADGVHSALGPIGKIYARAAWIGLESVNKKKKTWKWSNGAAVTRSFWNEGEPNDFEGHEECGEFLFANAKWNDTRCDLAQPYVCASASTDAKAPFDCPRGGRKFQGGSTGDTYCYVRVLASLPEAKRMCAQHGGRLATPDTPERNADLKSFLGQRFEVKHAWLGANALADSTTFHWPNGRPLTFTSWSDKEPNAFGPEYCVELFMDTWKWNDLRCDEPLPSICESAAL